MSASAGPGVASRALRGVWGTPRPPGDPSRVVPVLDGARGYALVIVVVYHCWIAAFSSRLDDGFLRNLVASSFLGVNFFFVISGFVLFLPVVRRGSFGGVRDYAIRRVARIVPAYYVSLIGLALLFPLIAAPGQSFWERAELESLGIHALFLQRELLGSGLEGMYGFGSTTGFGYNGPLWSLSIEALFYVTLPVVALVYLRRPVVALVLAIVGQLCWRYGAWNWSPGWLPDGWEVARQSEVVVSLAYQFPAFLGNLAVGMTAAWVYLRVLQAAPGGGLARARRLAGVAQVGALAGLLGLMAYSGHIDNTQQFGGAYFRYFRDLLPSLAFAVVILLAALCARPGQIAWANRPARWLGDVSYGAYLWHGMVLWIALWHLNWFPTPDDQERLWPLVRLVGVVLPTSLLLGWLSFRFVEQPAIRWVRRRQGRPPRTAAPPAPSPEPARAASGPG